jgi:ABC-type nitrate/sulfonate/bicarbonate transport system substrate-binding protein
MNPGRLWSPASLVLPLGLACALAACAPTAAPAQPANAPPPAAAPPQSTSAPQPAVSAPEQTTVKVGAFPISSLAPFYIADMKGWFAEEGLTIEKVSQFGPQGLTVLESGGMDLNFGDTISTTVALSKGFKFTIVAPASSARDAPPDSATLLVPIGSPIKSARALEGNRVAVDAIGGIGWTYLSALVENEGGDPRRVQFVELPFPQMPDALLNNQVDAAQLSEPGRSFTLKTGRVEVVTYPIVAVQPGAEISHIVARQDWVQRNPETLRRFLRAYQRGIALINEDEAEARRLTAEFAKLPPDIAEGMAINAFRPTVRPEVWQRQIEFMVKYKVLDTPLEIRPFVHESALTPPR